MNDSVRQREVPITYKGVTLSTRLRLDLLVEDRIVVECKAASEMSGVFKSQILTYIRALDLPVGLLVNFGKRLVKDGIVRIVNKGATPL